MWSYAAANKGHERGVVIFAVAALKIASVKASHLCASICCIQLRVKDAEFELLLEAVRDPLKKLWQPCFQPPLRLHTGEDVPWESERANAMHRYDRESYVGEATYLLQRANGDGQCIFDSQPSAGRSGCSAR